MAETVVAFLLNELSTFLHSQNINLGGGLQLQVQYIRDELGSMRAFLRDAEAKEDDVSELQEWVKQVREVAYDTEDVLDEFIMRFGRRHPDGLFGRFCKMYSSIKNMRARHQIASKIEDIKSRVQDVSARHQRYQAVYGNPERGSSSVAENVESHIRGNALLLDEAKLVGIAEPKRQLISQILDENSNLKVVSVVGMGGLGKTTLVRKVYEDTNVKRQFQIHAWLTISQTFGMKVVLNDLIQQLYNEIHEPVPPQVESMDGGNLRAFVKNFLQERRYIIVLDDLWKLESWEAIKYAFPDANCGGRVMLTTRIADTAFGCCVESHDYVHKMKALSFEESWTLFCSKIFGNNCCPPHLEDVSRRILGKCKGLPLAIVSIGGVLALKDKSKLDEWEMIRGNLGGELEGAGKLDRLNKILLLSYSDLPFFLKNCLLYMSIYPEDTKIYVESSIRRWIAEGFALEREGMTIVEVARGYLNELVNRSLIQVAELGNDGNIRYCRIHDIVREIILKKSREQNLATVATGGDYTRLSANIRRLVLYGLTENHHEHNQFRHLRSLTIFECTSPLLDPTLSELLSGGPKLLKVLDLEGAELKHIPNEVFKLFHLKYLSLKGTGVEIIPQSIGKLQNLEYLNLVNTNVMELPADILKLRKLRELYVYRKGKYSENYAIRGFKAPHKIGRLHSMEGLYCINVDNDEIVREIGKLTQLRNLSITEVRSEYGKELCSSLGKLTNLHELFVHSITEGEILDVQHPISPTPPLLRVLQLRGRLEKVPQWVPSLQGLKVIQLYGSGLREDALESLRDLPNLLEVVLNKAYEGEELCFKAGDFQKLKRLELTKLQKLKRVKVEKDALPCLQILTMADCKLVEELPCGIQNLNDLQFLGLYDMGDELIKKLQDKGSEEHRKIAQITRIDIVNWVNGRWSFLI